MCAVDLLKRMGAIACARAGTGFTTQRSRRRTSVCEHLGPFNALSANQSLCEALSVSANSFNRQSISECKLRTA